MNNMSGHIDLFFVLLLVGFCAPVTAQKLTFLNASTLFLPSNSTHRLVLVCKLTGAGGIDWRSQFVQWWYNRGNKKQISLSRSSHEPSDQGRDKFMGLAVSFNPRLNTYSLTIPQPISPKYSGLFECLVTSRQPGVPAASDKVTLIVVEPPSKVVVMPDEAGNVSGPISLPVGVPERVSCLVSGQGAVPLENIKIDMKIGDTTLKGTKTDVTVSAGEYAFIFKSGSYTAKESDSGKDLTCTASIVNEEGQVVEVHLRNQVIPMTTSSSRVISLPVPPIIDCGKDVRYSKIGTRNLNITCIVSGSGQFSEAQFTMPNNAIVDSNTNSREFQYRAFNVGSQRPRFLLFIHKVDKESFGTYTFNIRNRIGFSTKKVQVRDVGERPPRNCTAANHRFTSSIIMLLTFMCSFVVLCFCGPEYNNCTVV